MPLIKQEKVFENVKPDKMLTAQLNLSDEKKNHNTRC